MVIFDSTRERNETSQIVEPVQHYVQARHGQAIAKRLRSWLKRPQNQRAKERWLQHDSGFSAALQQVEACKQAVDRRSQGPRLA